MFIQVWSNGLHKLPKVMENHVHIRSTDHFKQVGVRGKNDRNGFNNVDDQCVSLCVHTTFSSSIGKVLELPDGWFVPTEFTFCYQFFSFCWLWLHFHKGAS